MAVHRSSPRFNTPTRKNAAFIYDSILLLSTPSFIPIAKRKRNACLRPRFDETIYNIKLNILSINQLIY